MAKSRLDVSSESAVSMPMKNLISIIGAVGIGVWSYFGLVERLNNAETSIILIQEDIKSETARIDKNVDGLITGDIAQNNEFRIKWPRGELGALPDDAVQDLNIEYLQKEMDKLQQEFDDHIDEHKNDINTE